MNDNQQGKLHSRTGQNIGSNFSSPKSRRASPTCVGIVRIECDSTTPSRWWNIKERVGTVVRRYRTSLPGPTIVIAGGYRAAPPRRPDTVTDCASLGQSSSSTTLRSIGIESNRTTSPWRKSFIVGSSCTWPSTVENIGVEDRRTELPWWRVKVEEGCPTLRYRTTPPRVENVGVKSHHAFLPCQFGECIEFALISRRTPLPATSDVDDRIKRHCARSSRGTGMHYENISTVFIFDDLEHQENHQRQKRDPTLVHSPAQASQTLTSVWELKET